jgi:hypothetical protein
MCSPGFGDCDNGGAKGCDTDLAVSRQHCGKCGRTCFGGNCDNGVCTPALLAGEVNAPVQITTDDATIYGINAYGTVTQIAKAGGPLVVRVPGDATAQSPPPRIALANDTIYFTALGGGPADAGPTGGVYSYALDGGTKTQLVAATAPLAVAANDTHVYWGEGSPAGSPTAGIRRCELPSCDTPEVVVAAEPGRIMSIVLANGNLIYANAGYPGGAYSAIKRCALAAGCTPEVLATSPPSPFAVTADNTNAYWTTLGTVDNVETCTMVGCSDRPTALDTLQYQPRFIAMDGPNLFWTSADGTIKSIPHNGPASAERVLYTSHGTSPWDIDADATAIYFTDVSGVPGVASSTALYKLAR